MTLSLIGIGLSNPQDITLAGLERIHKADTVYLDCYTSALPYPLHDLEVLLKKKVEPAHREMVEQEAEYTILLEAATKNVAFLVVGDPLCATTHLDLIHRAQRRCIEVAIIPNASVLTAVGITGLQLYKFGKTASIPFPAPGVSADSAYRTLQENHRIGAHTLFLLDLDPARHRYMTIPEGIEALAASQGRINDTVLAPTILCVGCSALGGAIPVIKAGPLHQVRLQDFGKGPSCFIIPGPLHFMEEETLAQYSI